MADIMLKKEPVFHSDQTLLRNNQPMSLKNSGNLSQPTSLEPTSLPTEEMNSSKIPQSNMFKLQRNRSK